MARRIAPERAVVVRDMGGSMHRQRGGAEVAGRRASEWGLPRESARRSASPGDPVGVVGEDAVDAERLHAIELLGVVDREGKDEEPAGVGVVHEAGVDERGRGMNGVGAERTREGGGIGSSTGEKRADR